MQINSLMLLKTKLFSFPFLPRSWEADQLLRGGVQGEVCGQGLGSLDSLRGEVLQFLICVFEVRVSDLSSHRCHQYEIDGSRLKDSLLLTLNDQNDLKQ